MVLPPGSAAFVEEGEGGYHFGEALVAFEEADDEVMRLIVLEGNR